MQPGGLWVIGERPCENRKVSWVTQERRLRRSCEPRGEGEGGRGVEGREEQWRGEEEAEEVQKEEVR